MSDTVRVRFAPSPTGLLHIGGLRTALYNYLFAKHHNGKFILRIEDTDQNRYVDGAENDITTSLKWAGLNYDEGPDAGGEFGPYRQSERSALYLKYAEQLIAQGNAYYAFDTPEDIEHLRAQTDAEGNATLKYDASTRMSMKNSLSLSGDETLAKLNSGEPYVIRLKVPESKQVIFYDIIRGHVSFDSSELDDQVLVKSDGLPTYHLANVVDDHLMQISHVIRGEEWLSSAPKHVLLYEYLGWETPKMAHLPLIMSPTGGKLSKRNAEKLGIPVNVRDYINGKYEPEALINFLAFLGWNPGDDSEILPLNELITHFSLEKVSKSGAVFNIDKLTWYNEHYFRSRSETELLPMVKSDVNAAGFTGVADATLLGAIRLMKERVSNVAEIMRDGRFFFEAPSDYDEKTVAKAWKEETPALLSDYVDSLKNISEFDASQLKDELTRLVEAKGLGFGKLMLPLRLAVTGVGGGPDLFETMQLLGRDEVLARINRALQKLS